jgi:hypothetical protein
MTHLQRIRPAAGRVVHGRESPMQTHSHSPLLHAHPLRLGTMVCAARLPTRIDTQKRVIVRQARPIKEEAVKRHPTDSQTRAKQSG